MGRGYVGCGGYGRDICVGIQHVLNGDALRLEIVGLLQWQTGRANAGVVSWFGDERGYLGASVRVWIYDVVVGVRRKAQGSGGCERLGLGASASMLPLVLAKLGGPKSSHHT